MIRPLLVAVMTALLVSSAVSVAHAASHGPALKGQEIDRAAVFTGQTGACVCMEQWYTVGLRPGKATVRGTLKACGDRGQPYCFMVVSLIRGNTTLKQVAVQCPSNTSHCNRAWSLSYRIRQAGAYYLQVKGEVGLTMGYTLHPHARIYRLHCGKYC